MVVLLRRDHCRDMELQPWVAEQQVSELGKR